MKLWRNYIFLGLLPSLKCRQFKRVILMGRIPRLKWLVPRFVLVLLFVACVQLIAYMGVIPSTLQNTDVLCNCQSAVSECATSNDETTENFSKDKAPVTSSVRKNFEQKQGVEEQFSKRKSTDHGEEEKAKAHLQDLNRLGKELKQLAKDMVETQRDVVKFATIYHRLGRHISSVNSLLHSIKHPPVDVNQNVLGKRTLNSDKTMKNVVCPEKFLGKDLSVGYPWFRKGFATENCTHSTPMRKLITVLLHIHEQLPKPAKDLVTLVKSLGKQYPGVEIVIATSRDEPRLKNLSSTLTNSLKLRIFSKNHQGQVWSSLLNDVVTPFVFSATDLTHFDDDIDFVRLIRVLSNSEEVVIAGGGYRNQKGLWDIGCLQTSFRNWTMSFRGGYYQSSGDCLACDYLEGPWVGKTEVLKKIGFDKGLEKGAFHDMFWRIKKALPGNIAVSCPDIMFNIHTNPVPDSYYVQLASKWEIKKWVDASGQVRWYGCRRGFQHNIGTQSCAMSKGVANPPCDLENFADAIKFLMKECEDAGLFCELQEGTLLGAVKFNKVLPWERDADITFLTANYTALKKLRPKFVEQGYTLSDDDDSLWCCVDGRQAGGKFTVGTSRFTIEMYGQHMMESELLVASGQSPTKVQFAGQWVNVVRNPGLYARNRYGPNHFRHAEHWMDLGQGTGWEFYHPGTFSACPYPNHSACLDQYPADGNIQFSDYTSK